MVLNLECGYNEAQSFLQGLDEQGIAKAIANLTTPINDSDVPEILRTPNFAYTWFRYLFYRFHTHGEILSADTLRLQLEFLAGEEEHYGQAEQILKQSIMNNTKSLYPITKRQGKKEYAQRTSRATRAAGNDTVTDTVLTRLVTLHTAADEDFERH